MRGRVRVDVVGCVPEHATVVRRLVLDGVIDVDVGDVRGKLRHLRPPAAITGSKKLQRKPSDRVVLIVIVRDEGRRTAVVCGFVVAVDVAEVAPPILIDDLSFAFEGLATLNGRLNERRSGPILFTLVRDEIGYNAGSTIPLGIRSNEK